MMFSNHFVQLSHQCMTFLEKRPEKLQKKQFSHVKLVGGVIPILNIPYLSRTDRHSWIYIVWIQPSFVKSYKNPGKRPKSASSAIFSKNRPLLQSKIATELRSYMDISRNNEIGRQWPTALFVLFRVSKLEKAVS